MTSYRAFTQPQDSKREEFKKYLEKGGVLDAITKVLVSLYEEPEKPEDALKYFKEKLSVASPDVLEKESIERELATTNQQLEDARREIEELKQKLAETKIEDGNGN
ncbi:c-Myc-binding protein [Tachypleus tridentatus]|uniref:c-Myc-binding protein n=1 Tax=Tachypleus tridentatus TaxID=6853 RepID=UPI003FCF5C50